MKEEMAMKNRLVFLLFKNHINHINPVQKNPSDFRKISFSPSKNQTAIGALISGCGS
jgi:hypothetical protein